MATNGLENGDEWLGEWRLMNVEQVPACPENRRNVEGDIAFADFIDN
jgi:hypothetical protein